MKYTTGRGEWGPQMHQTAPSDMAARYLGWAWDLHDHSPRCRIQTDRHRARQRFSSESSVFVVGVIYWEDDDECRAGEMHFLLCYKTLCSAVCLSDVSLLGADSTGVWEIHRVFHQVCWELNGFLYGFSILEKLQNWVVETCHRIKLEFQRIFNVFFNLLNRHPDFQIEYSSHLASVPRHLLSRQHQH